MEQNPVTRFAAAPKPGKPQMPQMTAGNAGGGNAPYNMNGSPTNAAEPMPPGMGGEGDMPPPDMPPGEGDNPQQQKMPDVEVPTVSAWDVLDKFVQSNKEQHQPKNKKPRMSF